MSHKTTYQICKEHPAFQTIRTMAESIKHQNDGKIFSKQDPSCPMTVVSANAHANLLDECRDLHIKIAELTKQRDELLQLCEGALSYHQQSQAREMRGHWIDPQGVKHPVHYKPSMPPAHLWWKNFATIIERIKSA